MLRIAEVLTEYQKNPIGLDEKEPRFSWILKSEEKNCRQQAYQVKIGSAPGGSDVWDTGKVEDAVSAGIPYAGGELASCTRYFLTVTVWDQEGRAAENKENWFETGLLDPKISAWEGARWIGAPEKYLSADAIGVFVLTSVFQIKEGGKSAGIVFGAKDARLMDGNKNVYGIAGENYIRYEINVEEEPAILEIYRVGYHPEDSADRPLARIPLVEKGNGIPLITKADRYEKHELKIEVTGNCAYAYIDQILADSVEFEKFGHKLTGPRQLNPLGDNDVTTFPRLNEIGYYAGKETEVHFDGIRISNYRAPGRKIRGIDEEEGITLQGGADGKQITQNPSAHSLPMFRRDFAVQEAKGLKDARLYITARGIYDCRINGKEITDSYFNPGASQYDKHIMYQTYDVTGLLQNGENGIAVTLASGWWCDAQTFVVSNFNYYGDQESFLAKLVLRYEDGSREVFVTEPEEWDYYGDGPYTYSGFFQGEHQDGRRQHVYDDFSKPGYRIPERQEGESGGRKRPVEIVPAAIEAFSTMPPGFGRVWPKVDHGNTQIVGGIQAPVVEVCRLQAKSMSEPRGGVYIYDLGQEIAGIPVLRLKGKAGTLVTVRYGEMLYPALPEYGSLQGMMLTENYRDAESIDKYILRGDPEGEVFTPKFSFHGYRYIEISGVGQAPALSDVGSIQLSSVAGITGKLETSNPLLNRFIENVKWSQLCNFISIPTDCPQRNERMGWAGDTHVFCRTATYQGDVRLFYYRYLEALADLQEEDGQLPNIAPVGGGFGGITYESAMILIVWELYQQFGDKEVIRRYYGPMKKWCGFIRGQGMPGMQFVGPLGDWLAFDETDNSLLWNAFYAYDMELMKKMSEAIGEQEEAGRFAQLEQEAKAFWMEHFVDKETGMAKGADGQVNDTQCAYALPLAYHMYQGKYKDLAYGHLARKVSEAGETIRTGFFGTPLLNPMLSEGGHTELACRLIQQTAFPSWLYPVTQGATTIWERWNSYTEEDGFGGNNSMNSFNHYSLGAVLSWMYETVLGIRRDEGKPGYGHFTLQPAMQGFDHARGGFDTCYGRINSSWEKDGDGYRYECDIPCNTTAELVLEANGKLVKEELGSGHYCFRIG